MTVRDRSCPEADGERMEAGRLLFARPPAFMLGVARIDQLPPADIPEVAIAGRSNVGKSSIINALTRHRELARTSNTPGRTQQLNFFDIDGRLRLIDLPGYGYAKAPKDQVDAWHALIFDYLRGRPNLHLVVLLIDGRHGIKDRDRAVMDTLKKAAVPFLIVLTKCDLVGRRELAQRTTALEDDLRKTVGALPQALHTSSRKLEGIEALRGVLAGYALDDDRRDRGGGDSGDGS
ncbi:MAG: YihA family ribosome biogenesis GTP-binding protein [Geminicoccaceae bacterium]|nr:YihA family ribosome biogenesis GTP-binding protein [Geminicoccaceae bacterium]